MESNAGVVSGRSTLRDWIDPSRIYNTRVPAERWPYFWGLVVYPLVVIFFLLTASIIILESFGSAASVPDYIGIVTYIFMLAWVAAAVAACLRRLRYFGMSQMWTLVIVLPVVSLIFFLYLLLRSGPATAG